MLKLPRHTDINALAAEIHQENVDVGWWDKPRCEHTMFQLVLSEVAEAMEGDRKSLMDDHLPNRPMREVEIADTMIRLLDMAGHYGWVYDESWVKDDGLDRETMSVFSADLFLLSKDVVMFGVSVISSSTSRPYDGWQSRLNRRYSLLIDQILDLALRYDLDLFGAIAEKRAYNMQRADHKRANRSQSGGKAY